MSMPDLFQDGSWGVRAGSLLIRSLMFHVEQLLFPVGEIRDWLITGLGLCLRKIDRAPFEPGGCPCLESAQGEMDGFKGSAQGMGGRFPGATA